MTDTLRVARQHDPCLLNWQPEDMSPGNRLKAARVAAKLSRQQLADRMHYSVSSIGALENGQNGIRQEVAAQLATIVKVAPEWLLYGDGVPPTKIDEAAPEGLTIRGDVQAGAWLQVNMYDQREPETYPAAIDPRYPRARQWLSRVRGDSMNDLRRDGRQLGIFEGDLVHCVDCIDIDYVPRTDDIVEVERVRFEGAEIEVTLKQVEVRGRSDILLWPRSTNPVWKDPIRLTEGTTDGENMEIRIRGRMLQVLRRW